MPGAASASPAGAAVTVTEVNDLLQRFNQMRKMMKNMGKMKKMMARAHGANVGTRNTARPSSLTATHRINHGRPSVSAAKAPTTAPTTKSSSPTHAARATANSSRSSGTTIRRRRRQRQHGSRPRRVLDHQGRAAKRDRPQPDPQGAQGGDGRLPLRSKRLRLQNFLRDAVRSVPFYYRRDAVVRRD